MWISRSLDFVHDDVRESNYKSKLPKSNLTLDNPIKYQIDFRTLDLCEIQKKIELYLLFLYDYIGVYYMKQFFIIHKICIMYDFIILL